MPDSSIISSILEEKESRRDQLAIALKLAIEMLMDPSKVNNENMARITEVYIEWSADTCWEDARAKGLLDPPQLSPDSTGEHDD